MLSELIILFLFSELNMYFFKNMIQFEIFTCFSTGFQKIKLSHPLLLKFFQHRLLRFQQFFVYVKSLKQYLETYAPNANFQLLKVQNCCFWEVKSFAVRLRLHVQDRVKSIATSLF